MFLRKLKRLNIGGYVSGQKNIVSSAGMCRPAIHLHLGHLCIKVHRALAKEANTEVSKNLHMCSVERQKWFQNITHLSHSNLTLWFPFSGNENHHPPTILPKVWLTQTCRETVELRALHEHYTLSNDDTRCICRVTSKSLSQIISFIVCLYATTVIISCTDCLICCPVLHPESPWLIFRVKCPLTFGWSWFSVWLQSTLGFLLMWFTKTSWLIY